MTAPFLMAGALHEPLGLSLPEVAMRLGIQYRVLDYWTAHGFVQSSIARAEGPGSHRVLSREDGLEILAIIALRDLGIGPATAGVVTHEMRAIARVMDSPMEMDGLLALLLPGPKSLIVREPCQIAGEPIVALPYRWLLGELELLEKVAR